MLLSQSLSALIHYVPETESFIDDLGIYSEIMTDKSGLLEFAEVSSLKWNSYFRENGSTGFNLSMSRDAVWIRFSLKNTDTKLKDTVIALTNPLIWYIDLYVPVTADESVIHLKGGSYVRNGKNSETYRYSVFSIPDNIDENRPVYLRLQTESSRAFNLYAADKHSLDRYLWKELIFLGLIGGILMAMLLYNAVLAFFLRDNTYITYVLYLAAINFYYVFVQGIPWFWDIFTPIEAILIAINIAYIFASFFSRSFLLTKTHTPLLDKIILTIPVLSVINLGILPFNSFLNNQITYMTALYASLIFIISGIVRYRQKFTPARYYFIAWILLNAGAITYSLRGIGFLPNHFLIKNASYIGICLETFMLSLALVNKVKLLRSHNDELLIKQQRLTQISITDALTGIYNKRHFSAVLKQHFRPGNQRNEKSGLIMIDVDHFKSFNDSYGHPQGDIVLSQLGAVLKECLREKDVPCRYGGEEFTVIVFDTYEEDLFNIAERIRIKFSEQIFKPEPDTPVSVTLSCGTALERSNESSGEFTERADKALYEAKKTGRNRTISGEIF